MYALIPDRPDDKVLPNDKIVLVRHFFGEVGKEHADAVTFVLKPEKGIGNASPWTRRVELFMKDATKSELGTSDVGQLIPNRFVPPHEISHIFGWPDEYMAHNPDAGFCPGWFHYPIEGCMTRIYAGDLPGMMSSGSAMRLRWYWIYGNRVNATELTQMLGGVRYVPRHEWFGTEGLSYRLPYLPPAVMADEVNKNPHYPVLGPTPHASSRAELTIHRLGHDEGTARYLFASPATKVVPAKPAPQRPSCPIIPNAYCIDAVVTITIRFMFGFEQALDNAPLRNHFIKRFEQRIVDPWGGGLLRFLVEPDWPKFETLNPGRDPKLAPYLRRIIVNFRPLFEVESSYLPKNQQLPPGVHVWVRVHPDVDAPPPDGFSLLKENHVGLVHAQRSECNLALVRYALGLPTFTLSPSGPVVDNTLSADDMKWVLPILAKVLNDPIDNARILMPV